MFQKSEYESLTLVYFKKRKHSKITDKTEYNLTPFSLKATSHLFLFKKMLGSDKMGEKQKPNDLFVAPNMIVWRLLLCGDYSPFLKHCNSKA
jgi:hypothetical protein